MIVYRIKSIRTGMYYNRKRWTKNPSHNAATVHLSDADDYYDKKTALEEDDFEGAKKLAHEYNAKYFKSTFSELGDIFYSRGGAEQVLTRLTKTNKKTRSTKAGLVLHGTDKASYYKIVASKLVDIDET